MVFRNATAPNRVSEGTLRLPLRLYFWCGERIVLLAYTCIALALLVLFPLISVSATGEDQHTYLVLAFLSVFLFLLPTWGVARFVRHRITNPDFAAVRADIPAALFFIGVLISSALFAFFAFKYDLYFRRIGFERLVYTSLAMPSYALAVQRTFMEVAVTLLCSTAAILAACRSIGAIVRALGWSAFLGALAVYFPFVLMNNRFQSVILIFGLLATYIYFRGNVSRSKQPTGKAAISVRWRFGFAALAGLALLAVASMRITENIRNHASIAGCITLHALNPFETPEDILQRAIDSKGVCHGWQKGDYIASVYELTRRAEASGEGTLGEFAQNIIADGVVRPLAQRLNGLGLMVAITTPALEKGFGWGRFWEVPALVNLYTFTDPDKAAEIKRAFQTNAKVHIARYYLDKEIQDTPSTVLTDLYANFTPFGFLLGALVFGSALGFTDRTLHSGKRAGLIVLAFFVMEKSLYTEKEFITYMIDLMKFSPIPLMSTALLWRVKVR